MNKRTYLIDGFKGAERIFSERRSLNLFEALLMKIRIILWNCTHSSTFIIEKYEGIHFRV